MVRMAAAWLWVGASWRRARAGMLVVILLCGLAGAVVATVAAGPRPAATSAEPLAGAVGAADVLVNVGEADPAVGDAIARLPAVEDTKAFSLSFTVVDGVDADVGLF